MTLFDSQEIRAALQRYLTGKYQGDAEWFQREGDALTLKGLLAIIQERHPSEVGAVARMIVSRLAVADPRKAERLAVKRRAYDYKDFDIGYAYDLPHGVPGARSFVNYQTLPSYPDTAKAFEAVRAWLDGRSPPILVLAGPNGTGKSHLADAAGQELLSHGQDVLYRMEIDLLTELRQFANAQHMEAYATVPWLIIDDIGTQTAEWAKPIQDQVIHARWAGAQGGGLRTLVTMNLKAQDLPPRIASRLADVTLGRAVTIAAPDYRRHPLRKGVAS